MGQWLSERLGQPFVIENRTGAGSNIATEAVVNALPDGYTLLLVVPGNAVNATLYKRLNYNFIRDIAPVAGVIRVPNVMEVTPSLPVQTVSEFIAFAKANPGKVNMASGGIGTSAHLAGELFKMMTGVNMVHVPYRGMGLAFPDLLAGHVQVTFDTTAGSIEYIRAGKLRAGRDYGDALGGTAGHPDSGGLCPGLRGKRVGWHRQPEEHARRDRRQAQQGDQCGPRRSQDEGTAC
jgi:tripartite-type tricarboxylate transporter receptor subunit TctC